ncbi:hypothetical protein PXH69_29210 [Rhodococcus qingshengii]|uniref:Uncharacterized protein n=2 Tax=Rhodococcus erythropolis group TaxID=2840174 RepID=A0AAW6LXJ2_RHOSG|nr:hypothetical protein [Rhodococcus qingshengii]MDE8649058.1 hypothetical protein [Rhodococcus qingshengii]
MSKFHPDCPFIARRFGNDEMFTVEENFLIHGFILSIFRKRCERKLRSPLLAFITIIDRVSLRHATPHIRRTPMQEFNVEWRMPIEAESPREAAEMAFRIQRDPESTATAFVVDGVEIDLGEDFR